MKLYNIHYKGDDNNSRIFEGVTDNFEKWLKQHNAQRKAENNREEDADEFEVEEISIEFYEKENVNGKS